MLQLSPKGALFQQISSESKEGVKKLVLVLAISTPVTGTREEMVENTEAIETAGAGKDGKENESEYLKNLTQVPCI